MKKILLMLIILIFCSTNLYAADSPSSYKSAYGSGGYKSLFIPPENGPENYSISYNGDLKKQYWLLRFYIPPVAKGQVNLGIFCSQGAIIGAVARLGLPPQCDLEGYTYDTINSKEYANLPWKETAYSLSQLRNGDCQTRNKGGSIGIVTERNGSSPGEWLFVKILYDGRSPHIPLVNFSVQCKLSEYTKWYNSVNWDNNGDPPLTTYSLPKGNCDFGMSGTPIIDPKERYTINVTKSGSGYIEPQNSILMIEEGKSQTFKFMSDFLFKIPLSAKVYVGNSFNNIKYITTGKEYTIENINEDKYLLVNFNTDNPIPEKITYLMDETFPQYELPVENNNGYITFSPYLKTTNSLYGSKDIYVCYLYNNKLYFLKKDYLTNNIVADEYCLNEELNPIGEVLFSGENEWQCDILNNYKILAEKIKDIVFYVGIGDLNNLEGAKFTLQVK